MIPNYILSNWYTFGTRPKWKNAGGFVLARLINYPLQLVLLPIFIELLPNWPDEYISYLVIVLGGVVNYFMCLFFFKNKKK
jgi:putative flippase GtrA